MGPLKGNQYFKHKVGGGGGGGIATPLVLPWIRKNSFFRLCTEGQSNGDRARCQRNKAVNAIYMAF